MREEADRRNPVLPSVKADAFQAAFIVLQRYFEKEDFRTVVHHQETWYSYYKELWSERTEEDIDFFIHDKLQHCRVVTAEGDLRAYPTTQAVVNEIKFQIKQMVGIPSHFSTPLLYQEGKWLQQDVRGKMVCKGKIIDMKTGDVFSNHALFIPNGADWVFDLKAKTHKNWDKFIKSIKFNGTTNESLLQEWFGYIISGDTWAQKGLILIGPKRSGKGTIGHVLSALLGKSMVSSPTLSSLAGDFGLATLLNKRLCLVSDARLGTRADAVAVVELLLRLVAGDAVDIQRKYKSPLTAVLASRVMMLSNEMPSLTDTSDAINSRFLIMQMSESFLGKEDHNLLNALISELPAIANWAMEGYRRLIKRGYFVEDASSEELREHWHADNNPVSEFLKDTTAYDIDALVSTHNLYQAYHAWSEHYGHARLSANLFSRRVTTIGGSRIRRGKTPEGSERVIHGLKLTQGKF